ncbi:MAG: hypothetical protein LBI40_02825 [Treponema sp.]|jgi:hypothetical protein|nr:hypothetical protein [Treponema sp.]
MNKKLSSPAIFMVYVTASCLVVMAFRYVLPGALVPLPIYAVKWRLIAGLMDVCTFFPAIVLAGFVVPFGILVEETKPFPRFSIYFFSRMTTMIAIAICATAVYGALLFLVKPLSQNYRETLIFNGELFRRSKENAQREANNGEWIDAERSILTCKRIWATSEEIKSLAEQIQINAIEMRLANTIDESRRIYNIEESYEARSDRKSGKQEMKPREPINAAEALELAQKALDEKRFYDAHWLASVGMRIAKKNGPEYKQAVLIEANAWKAINQMEPSAQESKDFAFYREKRNGYIAMDDQDWLKAYHIFYRLAVQKPGDPDIVNSLALSKEKVTSLAFFLNREELSLGEIVPKAFYSLPVQNVRIAMRIGYLSVLTDAAYGRDIEIDIIDHENRLLRQVKAPYCKVFPQADNERNLFLMLRAIVDGEQFDPTIDETTASLFENAQIRLDVNYDDFILLSKIQRGLDSFFIGELFRAQEKFGDYGYMPQVFQAEIVYRIFGMAAFLPIAISVIILGWRFRSKRKPQYVGIPMLLILPFVFNIFVLMCHEFISKTSILSVIGIGFVNSLIVFSVGTVICLFFALMGLATQREN